MQLHIPENELFSGLPEIERSPADKGVLEAIVVRPGADKRQRLDTVMLSPKGGVHGDRWADSHRDEPDEAVPTGQVTIINTRAIDLLAGSEERWELAGDNLYVDLDLSRRNLRAGQRLRIGAAELEITDQPHNGCKKFAHRYGTDAVRFVNSARGKELRLRGVYARVVTGGHIRVGDHVEKC
jgi:MOSC domain-containing protein YiiM